jgi:RHS repeat-associated protein
MVNGAATFYFAGGAYEVSGTVSGSTFTETKHMLYFSIAGQVIASDDGSGLQYFLTDHLGSMVAVLSSSGTLLSQQRYMPFGQVRASLGTITQTDFGYTGQRKDSYTGLMDYKARFYDGSLGRFLQPDSIVPGAGNPQNFNRFSYVGNSPINLNDPSGHKWTCTGANEDHCSDDGDGNTSGMRDFGLASNRHPGGGNDCGNGYYTGCAGANAGNGGFSLPVKNNCSNGYYTGCGAGVGVETDNDKNEWTKRIGGMATTLDATAAGLNGVYAIVGDLVSLNCWACAPYVLGIYQYYSVIPNSVSTISMGLWIGQGIITGENIINSATGSMSVSQDTIVAVTTNIAGWTILKEPNSAFLVDGSVFLYDVGRTPDFFRKDPIISTFINPSINYGTNHGWNFTWEK